MYKEVNVSIIIPAYNAEKYLEEAVMSCISQVYENICEIIIIDNNSKDNTYSIALELQKKFPKKILVEIELKKGASAARNKGLKIAKGNWIQFLDADDILLPYKIKEQVEIIKNSRIDNLAILFASFIKIYKHDSQVYNIKKYLPYYSIAIGNIACGCTCSNLWLRESLNKVGGFNENIASSQETNLMFSILKMNYNVDIDTKINTIVRVRNDGTQISDMSNEQTNAYNYIELRKEIIIQILKEYPNFFRENYFYSKKLYNTLLNRLLLIPDNIKITQKYKIETVAFLSANLYKPLELKFISNTSLFYGCQYRIIKIYNSKIGKIYKIVSDYLENKLVNFKSINNI